MKKLLMLLALLAVLKLDTIAQTQPFGKIDIADLELKECNFEKNAGAMVLFDKARVTYKYEAIVMEHHKRIKIFNDNGKNEANIRIVFYGAHESIEDLAAETINLNGKSIEYTPVDKKSIFTENVDKERKALVFTFPNVKPGSVIEFTYKFKTPHPYNYPEWYFQSSVPTRYSEFDADFMLRYKFNIYKKIYQPLVKDTSIRLGPADFPEGHRFIWAMANVKTYPHEPYMDYPDDYIQCITHRVLYTNETWSQATSDLLIDTQFGGQITRHMGDDDNINDILEKVKLLKTNDEKIALLFDTVKKSMKWNKVNKWYTVDGVKKAWEKKTGNATEINLILYNLLKAANVKALLMELKTRENGRLDTDYASLSQFNKTVVYCLNDNHSYYILDASNPYAAYNRVPYDLMDLTGLLVDADNKKYHLVTIKTEPAKEALFVNGTISDGKLEGDFQISSTSFVRENYLKQYGGLSEKAYIEKLQTDNGGIKITSLKFENRENDTLVLNQNFDFKTNLTEADGGYIYFNPNEFTTTHISPFLSENRVSNIDFNGLYNFSLNGRYKIPANYDAHVLLRPVNLWMPDKSIGFKRTMDVQNGFLIVHYEIAYKRSLFSKDEYPLIHEFFKKMYEALNEPVVLKKS